MSKIVEGTFFSPRLQSGRALLGSKIIHFWGRVNHSGTRRGRESLHYNINHSCTRVLDFVVGLWGGAEGWGGKGGVLTILYAAVIKPLTSNSYKVGADHPEFH